MSRIDKAMKQAGLQTGPDVAAATMPSGLDTFTDAETSVEATRVSAVKASARSRLDRSMTAGTDTPPASAPDRAAHDARVVKSVVSEKLVTHEKASRACIEQYRRVAAMLHQMQEERGTKVLMVASAQPGEGKTLTSANLALTLSESYQRRVLLIDADLRRPSLSALFHVQSLSGLSERLKSPTAAPLRVIDITERLALLPGGKPEPDPMAGLTSGRLDAIIEQAGTEYDWVILDTPPVGLQPDARLIAAGVEVVLLVIGAGLSQSALVQSAIETLGRDKIIGAILNRVDGSNESLYYNYYYGNPVDGDARAGIAAAP